MLLEFYAASGDFTRRLTSVKANSKFSAPDAGPEDYFSVRALLWPVLITGSLRCVHHVAPDTICSMCGLWHRVFQITAAVSHFDQASHPGISAGAG